MKEIIKKIRKGDEIKLQLKDTIINGEVTGKYDDIISIVNNEHIEYYIYINDIINIDKTSNIIDKINDTFLDIRDGNIYKTIKIGKQTWMAENLKYAIDEGAYLYDNENYYLNIYGRLYNWETAKKACPKGWHLPSIDEWMILIDFLGGLSSGGLMKKNISHPYQRFGFDGGEGATNKSGFSGLLGGYCAVNEIKSLFGMYKEMNVAFKDNCNSSYWWSSSEDDQELAHCLRIGINTDYISPTTLKKTYGLSIRCIKD